MKIIYRTLGLLALSSMLYGCGCNNEKKNVNTLAERIARKSLAEDYPKVPDEELLRETAGGSVYSLLKDRYVRHLSELKNAVAADQAKLVVVIMTPEVGKFTTAANTFGIPFIVQSCSTMGIDCVNFSPDIAEWAESDPTHVPMEGNWTRLGAQYTSNLLGSIIAKYENYRSPKVFIATKPETFGDLTTKEDEVMDEATNIPYRLTVNAQGLRMDHNLSFPKRKQTILFLGDGKIFEPYIDNEFITTEVLQKRFPDKEIVNAGHLKYTMEDYLSLYNEKARFTEPDIVVVCTNGGDIIDYYFSQRNKYARSGKCYKPTLQEKKFYEQMSK